jgi:hypothetical protein
MTHELLDLSLHDLILQSDLLDRFRLLGLYIQGVEVTQAVQYYRAAAHLTDPADRASDNAVTLIAGKPAWVRVYLRSGFLAQVANVTGTIEVSRRVAGFLYPAPFATLSPQPPGTVTAQRNPTYSVERGTLNSTLNFILPADAMCGHLRLRVHVTAPGGHEAETTLHLDVTLRQTLRLAGIMVGYNGPTSTAPGAPNLTLTAPTLANLQTTSGWTLLTFPVQSAATYRSAGTVTWNLPLTDAPSCPGCCTPNWVALNAAVQAQRVADGNRTDVLYYGLMAVGIPMGPIIGCNSGGVSTGSNGDGVTMAHELGHACGLPHAPCGTPGDPNYPAYEPYDPANTPQASIGEYGLDISTGNIFSPATFKDMMAYCGPRWISLYNYGRLTNNSNLDPVRACVDYPWWRDYILYDPILIPERWLPDPPPDPVWRQRVMGPEPVISIIGVVHSENEIEIKTVMRLEAAREVANGRATNLTAELIGKEGRVVASAPLYSLRSYGQGGCECGKGEVPPERRYPYTFQVFLSNVESGAALRIRSGERELWSRRAPESEPRITNFKATLSGGGRKRGEKQGNALVVEWQVASAGEREPECWLQWSNDRGKSWSALATGLRGGEATLDVSALPSGRLLLRLLASDGFHTAESKRVTVEIPQRPPAVSILTPRDGQTLIAGSPMRLAGAATLSSGEPAAGESARWLIDGKGAAAGLEAFITAPPAGEHRLTLLVTEQGERGEESIRFKTVKVPDERKQSK